MPNWETYDQTALAEDVVDEIYLISPVDTPVASMSKTTRATGTLHQWHEDALADAGVTPALEGADAPAQAQVAADNKLNACQIYTKTASVSGTIEKVDKYGRSSEMAYQLEKVYAEIANSEELAIVGEPQGQRQTYNAGDGSNARVTNCLQNQFHADVTVTSATGVTNTYEQLESEILAAHLATYDEGGTPNYLIVPPALALSIAEFASSAGRNRDISEKRLVNCIDLMVTPYGQLDVVLDRFCEATAMMLFDFNYVATPVLRTTADWALSKDGDYDARQVLRESTVALLNSKAGAIVDTITAPTSHA